MEGGPDPDPDPGGAEDDGGPDGPVEEEVTSDPTPQNREGGASGAVAAVVVDVVCSLLDEYP